jgi:hypothetical protein
MQQEETAVLETCFICMDVDNGLLGWLVGWLVKLVGWIVSQLVS